MVPTEAGIFSKTLTSVKMSEKLKIFFPSFAFFGRKASFESLKMCFKVIFGYGYA